jgi:hypothetical protein
MTNHVLQKAGIRRARISRSTRRTDALTRTVNSLALLEGIATEGDQAELVHVYEKIKPNIWTFNGVFRLVDSWKEQSGNRRVFKFKLELVDDAQADSAEAPQELEHRRVIPPDVKLAVWKRDSGRCVTCGSADNLHFDHVLPFSKGGSSLVAENVQLLCARHNLSKADHIY